MEVGVVHFGILLFGVTTKVVVDHFFLVWGLYVIIIIVVKNLFFQIISYLVLTSQTDVHIFFLKRLSEVNHHPYPNTLLLRNLSLITFFMKHFFV